METSHPVRSSYIISFRYSAILEVQQGDWGLKQPTKVLPINAHNLNQEDCVAVPMELFRCFESTEVTDDPGIKYRTEFRNIVRMRKVEKEE